MKIRRIRRLLIAAFVVVPMVVVAATSRPRTFTATYQVLRDGSDIGQSTLTLRADGDGTWTYQSSMHGTSGLAALLGASVQETSRFRWNDGRPEALSYDYRMDAAIKRKQRHVDVDWKGRKVSVDDGKKGRFSYAPQPGLVERHLLPLALGYVLAGPAAPTHVAFPVAVQNRVQTQTFKVLGKEGVDVPAGHFQALHVVRTDHDRDFSAWYVPERCPLPVKLAQSGGGDITLRLQRCSSGG